MSVPRPAWLHHRVLYRVTGTDVVDRLTEATLDQFFWALPDAEQRALLDTIETALRTSGVGDAVADVVWGCIERRGWMAADPVELDSP